MQRLALKEVYYCKNCEQDYDQDSDREIIFDLNWKCPRCSSLILIGDGDRLWVYRIPASKLRKHMTLIHNDHHHEIHKIIPLSDPNKIRLLLGGFGKLDVSKNDYVNVDLFDTDDEDF